MKNKLVVSFMVLSIGTIIVPSGLVKKSSNNQKKYTNLSTGLFPGSEIARIKAEEKAAKSLDKNLRQGSLERLFTSSKTVAMKPQEQVTELLSQEPEQDDRNNHKNIMSLAHVTKLSMHGMMIKKSRNPEGIGAFSRLKISDVKFHPGNFYSQDKNKRVKTKK
jgi:hypothetical protein